MKWKEKGKFITKSKLDSALLKIKSKQHWYEYLYDPDELQFYQDFQNDQYLKAKNIFNWAHVARIAAFSLCVIQILISLCSVPIIHWFQFFTKWSLLATTFSIGYSHKSIFDEDFKENKHKMALHNILYTLMIIMNFFTVSIYWTLIHRENIINLRN